MRIILFKTYELTSLRLYVIICIFWVVIIFTFTKLHFPFLTNFSLYSPNFANVASITAKIWEFQVFPLMCSLIVNVYM